jgi:hypothetical protein
MPVSDDGLPQNKKKIDLLLMLQINLLLLELTSQSQGKLRYLDDDR